MFNRMNLKKKRGFTLIEILLVVGFIALAGIGVYVVYEKVQATNRANQEVRNIRAMVAEIRSFNLGNASGLNQTQLIQLGIIPETMLDKTTTPITIKNSFGGTVTASVSLTNNLLITYNNLPKELCLPMAVALESDASRIAVGLAALLNHPAKYGVPLTASIPSINRATAASTCNPANGNNINLQFFFTVK